jgi:phospholipase/lecithinase/hemolysin
VPGFQLQYFDLFFDSVHPNARVHKIIGDRIADQLLQGTSAPYMISDVRVVSNPEPSTMLLTVSAAAAVLVVKRTTRRKSEL